MPVICIRLPQLLLAASLAFLVTACGGGGGGAASSATPPTNGGPVPNTVAGTVRFNGSPLAGATVTAFVTNTNTVFGVATTDAQGHYAFTGVPTGWDATPNLQFWAGKAGFAFYPSLAGDPTDDLWNAPPQNWYVSDGAAVSRAGYNGQFANPDGGSAILFATINFMSTTGGSITGADFDGYDGSNPTATIAATGQTISQAAGDDGALRHGVAWPSTRYVDNQDGTVTDHLTGLVWLKNAGCLAAAPWAAAVAEVDALASGACGLADGSAAGQWRLPNVVELESVVDLSAAHPAVTPGSPFVNVSSGIYWSSTPYFGGQEGTTNAWAIRFDDGRYMNDTTTNVMTSSSNAVWAVKGNGSGAAVRLQSTGAYVPFAAGDDGSVRSGQALPSPRMRDNADGTVTDTATGLIWLKKADCIQQTWTQAVAAVDALASGQCGLTDGSAAGSWRMPNRHEMESLADRAQNNMADYFDESFISGAAGIASQPAIFTNFVQLQYYWTSTTDAADTSSAWTVFSCDFGVYDMPRSATGYTLAVR